MKKVASAQYFVPMSKTFPAVDALLPNEAALFQVTTSAQHPVNLKGLEDALDVLPSSGEYKLYFPVPENRYADFKKQPFTGVKDGKKGAVVLERPGRTSKVHQYKLRVVMRYARTVQSVRAGLRASLIGA